MHSDLRRRGGFALITVMLVVVIVALLATSAAVIGSAHTLGNRYYDRQSQLDDVALEGLELARAEINADKTLYPADGFDTLEAGVSVTDGSGSTVPGVQRWLYVGPTGSTSGQYGVFGSIVAVARDAGGGVVVRRAQVYQESFAKFAYFTDIEPSNISFGGGDQIFGPLFTNDYLKIYSSGATFWDETRTAKTVQGAQYGTFAKGYQERVDSIPMPTTTDLSKLQTQATAGGTAFNPGAPSQQGQAYMRIEFIAVDLNGDSSFTGPDEGFFRVYQSTSDPAWVSGDPPSGGNGMLDAENCGDRHGGVFVPASDHPYTGHGWHHTGSRSGAPGINDNVTAALSNSTKRCYLGGSDSIFGGFQASDSHGSWIPYPGTPDPAVTAARPNDAQYLFPLSRALNPSFKGVIYVAGNVVVSGVVRGRVTLAASNEIIIGDDITYASDPALGTCADMLGMFSGQDVVVADNMLNSPQNAVGGANYFTYDDTKDEFIQGIVLALNNFTVENYAGGDDKAEKCGNELWGRGCLFLTGGIIQKSRGAVGTINSYGPGGTGYVKRYAYDPCGATAPPPYFPTTGHFAKGQIYWVDPTGFSVSSYFHMLTS